MHPWSLKKVEAGVFEIFLLQKRWCTWRHTFISWQFPRSRSNWWHAPWSHHTMRSQITMIHIRSSPTVYLSYQSNATNPILPIQSHHRTKFKLVHSINHNLSFCKSTQHLIYHPSITFYHFDVSSNQERSHHHDFFNSELFVDALIHALIWFYHSYLIFIVRQFHFEFWFLIYHWIEICHDISYLSWFSFDSWSKIIFRFAIIFQTLESIRLLHIVLLPRFNVIVNSELPMVTFFISLSIIDLISSFWSWI